MHDLDRKDTVLSNCRKPTTSTHGTLDGQAFGDEPLLLQLRLSAEVSAIHRFDRLHFYDDR